MWTMIFLGWLVSQVLVLRFMAGARIGDDSETDAEQVAELLLAAAQHRERLHAKATQARQHGCLPAHA